MPNLNGRLARLEATIAERRAATNHEGIRALVEWLDSQPRGERQALYRAARAVDGPAAGDDEPAIALEMYGGLPLQPGDAAVAADVLERVPDNIAAQLL